MPKRKAAQDRWCEAGRRLVLLPPSSASASPHAPSGNASTQLPRDLISFLNDAGLSSLIKMIGPYYMLSQLKGQKSLMALEFCQISFDAL